MHCFIILGTHYNTCVPLYDFLSISSLDGHTPTHKKLSDAIEEMQFNSLLNSSSLADKARLLSVSSPLNSINMLEAGMYQGVSAKAAEYRRQKMIPSVLSWTGDVYRWQWRALGPGDQRH